MKSETLAISMIMAILTLLGSCKSLQSEQTQKENAPEPDCSVDEFVIETLSDKDIYFKADTVLPEAPLFNDLMDVANGYAILRAAYCDVELWLRLRMPVKDEIASIGTDVIRDSVIRAETKRYKERLVNCLSDDNLLAKPDSTTWDSIWNAYTEYAETLRRRYSHSHYGRLSEKDVEEYLDRERFIPNYDSIYQLRERWLYITENFLEEKIGQAASFDEKCLYTVELAHQRRHEMPHPCVPKLEELMTSGKHSRYLLEVWRTWRVLKQINESPSRDGVILNLEYNQMRFRCLNTILKQIVMNPNDIMAINDFVFFASYNNIIRYNDLSIGNSALLEYMMLFPEILEDGGEEAEEEDD